MQTRPIPAPSNPIPVGTAAVMPRIVLVEDHPLNRTLLRDYLDYCGYDVVALAHGEQLFETLEQFQPQLVLLDLKLPKIDGYGLLKQIRHHPQWGAMPVIVVSALSFEGDRQRAIALGANQYFIKPVNLRHLIVAVRAWLQSDPACSDS